MKIGQPLKAQIMLDKGIDIDPENSALAQLQEILDEVDHPLPVCSSDANPEDSLPQHMEIGDVAAEVMRSHFLNEMDHWVYKPVFNGKEVGTPTKFMLLNRTPGPYTPEKCFDLTGVEEHHA